MVKSMTSFGRSQSEEGNAHLFSIEMKSVNNRYLDINVRMPKFIFALEEEIRKIINKRLSRGKVDVFINYKNYGESDAKPRLNMTLAKNYYDCLKEMSNKLGITDDITVTQIAKFPEVITLEVEEENLGDILGELTPLLNSTLDSMIDMRVSEGEKLKEDMLFKLKDIENNVNIIETFSHEIPKQYKARLKDRLQEITKGVILDEERLAMEVAILADKAAVDEEIIRLNSHVDQMRKTLNLNEPIGRKLDFIIQEMNRETNTIGSKSNDMHMTNIVIDIKNLIEKIREQVQNIE